MAGIAEVGDWPARVRFPAVPAVPAVVAVLVGIVVVAIGIAALATGRAGSWRSSGADVALSLPKADSAGASTPDSGRVADSASPSTTASGVLHVHAAGAVAHPGVVEVPAGSRVNDAVAAAGGAAPDADLNQVNLAALVTDGERIYIPKQGELGAGLGAAGVSATGNAAEVIVNLNEADATQLEALPGVGPATAQAILDYRSQHGRFHSVDDLLNVRGIGPSKLGQIKPHARV